MCCTPCNLTFEVQVQLELHEPIFKMKGKKKKERTRKEKTVEQWEPIPSRTFSNLLVE